ncbi:MAG: carbamoyltransferase HypF [Epsilonproteobacteria bacterium]|nr:carbamoyltransferase HypF [Nitratiruptor sp.]MRJ02890.1 carbamoyltransferase HypF [Campylobacterota bacterium]NPA82983.1 carbamoyltransferase HypF [Campylobacterota bacterium]
MRFRFFGTVQGVGFRPTVYRVAKELGLVGYVQNRSGYVEVAVEGKRAEAFEQALLKALPPLAKIERIEKEQLPSQNFTTFSIIQSQTGEGRTQLLPDMSVCDECLKDLFDPTNRRYHYPLINCTNCGPRYTIIKDLPYDRKNTTMAPFEMCKECRAEYEDPTSRFYHAQPIGCNECGPKVHYEEFEGFAAIEAAARAIATGKIVAIKGVGGFHLVCDATREEAVGKLRSRKGRARKPFAVMFKSLEAIREYGRVSETEAALITSQERPIVILKAKRELADVAPGIDRLGVFLPYSPIYYLLFSLIDTPLVVTSANISDTPIIKDEATLQRLGLHDGMLWYEREIERSCDDSVVTVADGKPLFYRLSRGFGPKSYYFEGVPSILAVGARQKNTIAIAAHDHIVLSPHIGDIKNIESLEYFQKVVEDFRRIYAFEPETIVCDKHPGYETAHYAKSLGKEVVQLQHHRAHVWAALAELELEHGVRWSEWVGFAWDGTGYGDDGKIWGGEVFVGDERRYHFDYFKICGGEKAIKDIRLQGWSLARAYGIKLGDRLFNIAYEKNINCFKTSSLGRLFDAVAFVAGLCERVDFDGEAGMLMERAYRGWDVGYYGFLIDEKIQIDFEALFKDDKALIPSRFINTLAAIILKIAQKEQKPVILTGGVFQNVTLLNLATTLLKKEGVPCFFPTATPINDGGIALGQVWWATLKRR